jgi:acyl carrier protein
MNVSFDRELRRVVLESLCSVAPDIDPDVVDPSRPFRDQFDFDSMDHLTFVTALHQRFRVDIPELDYPRLASLDGCVDYLQERADPSVLDAAVRAPPA